MAHLSSGGSFVREGALVAIARLGGLPVAVHLHGSDFPIFAARWPKLVGAVLRLAAKVYVLTGETEDVVRATLPASAGDRVVKVVNGVATPDRMTAKERLVVFAGEVGTRKGADILLSAWLLVHQENPAWNLIVAGPVERELRTYAAHPSIKMLGAIPRDEVQEWLSRASIAVLPSRHEALPMFLLESMAHGCAVVATAVGEVKELLEGCGVIVSVEDREGLGSALNSLIQAPDTVGRMGAAARIRIDERYSAAAVTRLFEHEWQILLESAGGA
ncbi:MAG TPA: glycosyltransferase family 4 protein [Pseudonocardia sp.]